MERDENFGTSDMDVEWQKLARSMSDGTVGSVPREATADERHPMSHPRTSPRDWTPANEVDDPFDPSELPTAEAAHEPSNPANATIAFGFSVGLLAIAVLAMVGVIEITPVMAGLCGFAGFISLALAMRWFAPWRHNDDDDGTRI